MCVLAKRLISDPRAQVAAYSSSLVNACNRGLRKLAWILVGSVIGPNMGFKLFVALQLEVAHDFIERFAFRSTGRFEPPSTFGATKTPKTLQINPYQLPALSLPQRVQRVVIGIKAAVYICQF